MAPTWPDLLSHLVAGKDLDTDQAGWAMGEVLAGHASDVHLAAFAVALRAKGETVTELSGLAEMMLELAREIELDRDAVDIVGTGGDRANTVNISTMASLVTAACGVRVVKHGNRAASSACGTADVLEELGVVLDLPPELQPEVMEQVGIVFLFASYYHSSLRHASGVRAGLGIQTTFNFLGPLANPARPRANAIGVADRRMAELMAGVLAARGNRGLVFHGGDGLDELTTTTTSQVWAFLDGQVVAGELDPRELGMERAQIADLVGGDRALNARIARETLAGEGSTAVGDIVALNAAAAMLAAAGPDLSTPLAEQLRPQLDRARAAIADGAATRLLDRWVQVTRELASR